MSNYHNVKNFYEIEFTGAVNLRIYDAAGDALFNVDAGAGTSTYYSEYGIVIDANGNFIGGEIGTYSTDAKTT